MSESNINNSFNELNIKFNKLPKYYLGLFQLINVYLKELIDIIENKNIITEVENLLLYSKFNDNIKKFKKYNETNSENDKIDYIKLFNNYSIIYLIKDDINIFISQIKIINIFDEKTLLSDRTKNNINQNKTVIIDLYNKISYKSNKTINLITEFCKTNYKLNMQSYKLIYDYYLNNSNIILIYVNIVKKYINDNQINNKNISDPLLSLILYNNNNDKNKIIINNTEDSKNLKLKKNDIKDFDYLFKNKYEIKNQNIVDKFNCYSSSNKYKSLELLFKDIQNSSFVFKTNDLNTKTFLTVQNIVNDLYKIEQQFINITFLETNIDKFNYNCFNLLNVDYKLNKDVGITNEYINKTKTIITESEYKNLEMRDLKYKNDMYIGYFDKMYNINNFNISNNKSTSSSTILFESQYILIVKLYIDNKNYEFHTMKYSSNKDIYMNFNQIRLLLQNKPDYYIENLNIIRNNKIIDNIDHNNMLNNYQATISSDYKNISKIDNLELKNTILNKIKKTKFKVDQNNKEKNINNIISIITDELLIYIQKTNNIIFSSELYLTYYSNINSLIKKVKKELNDNYNSDLLLNIENILNNIYSNIITINYNILDKYYLTKL
jgi:hypothetical protein